MKLDATNRYYGGGVDVMTPATRAVNDAAAAAVTQPAVHANLMANVKMVLPWLAAGAVLLGGIKIVEEKFILHDSTEVRGVRIDLRNLVKVGVMAMVFQLGAIALAGGISHAQKAVATRMTATS